MSTVHIANPWRRSGPDTFFDLDIVETDAGRVAFVHERADNHGVSITNAAEAVFAAVQEHYPRHVVEVYDDASFRYEGRTLPDSFELVTLCSLGHAHWRHLGSSREEAIDALRET